MNEEEYIVAGDDFVSEIVNQYPEAAEYLASLGMHCLGCASAQFETLWDACRAHGLKVGIVLRELNRRITGGDPS
jgi:hybrid cluster-associated redox disulfide protein